ncbi:undecaprenyl-diphosphate phosphatase [Verrucomicrobiota bacterium]
MFSFLKILLLAVVQGLTEFLPVSSSGHLVIAKHLLKLESPGALLEVGLHIGTLISILVYYRKRISGLLRDIIKNENNSRYYAKTIIIASLPIFAVAVLFADKINLMFESPMTVVIMLCVTGLILLSLLIHKTQGRCLNCMTSFFVGLAQAFALIPGISRSGITITLARHLGVSRERSAEFSFFIAIPALIGAAVKTLVFDGADLGEITSVSLIAGILVSACVGYFAIHCLLKILVSGKFWIFGVYCLIVGVLGVIMFL